MFSDKNGKQVNDDNDPGTNINEQQYRNYMSG